MGELPRKPCPECGKFLTNVKEHMKSVHWQGKNYICSHCDYSSSFKNDLVKHTISRHSHVQQQQPVQVKQIHHQLHQQQQQQTHLHPQQHQQHHHQQQQQ